MSASAQAAVEGLGEGKIVKNLAAVDDKDLAAKRAAEASDKGVDSILSTKQNINTLIDEIETISK